MKGRQQKKSSVVGTSRGERSKKKESRKDKTEALGGEIDGGINWELRPKWGGEK